MRVLTILNLRAGGRERRAPLENLVRRGLDGLGVEAEHHTTRTVDDIDAPLAEARRRGFDRVIVIGGDGTISTVGRRLIGAEVPLGIVPTGSGNGLARHLGIPLEPVAALRLAATGTPVAIDTGIMNGIPFLVTCGLGFDAEIAHRFAASATRGLRTYVVEGARAWLAYEPETVEIEIDGQASTGRCVLVTFANASQYGNDARVAPSASMNDGLLDVIELRRASLASAPALLWRLFRGSFDRSPHVVSRRGRAIVARRTSAGPVHIDGEPAMLGAELRLSVNPRSLNVIVPAWVTSV